MGESTSNWYNCILQVSAMIALIQYCNKNVSKTS